MNRIDYKRVFKESYGAKAGEATLVNVPPMQFLMLQGHGDLVAEPRFNQAVEALFKFAYAIKATLKKGPMRLDFTVMPLECLWRDNDPNVSATDPSAQQWTLMIMQPPVVGSTLVDQTRHELQEKKITPLLSEVQLAPFEEGKAVQTLHIGPVLETNKTLQHLHDFAAAQGYRAQGRRHEIYLSDRRRKAGENSRTLVRQPVEAIS